MSGGGTGLMSGGGESMGSIGRGKSGFGFGGCSMLIPEATATFLPERVASFSLSLSTEPVD